jgi:hypothetical protein
VFADYGYIGRLPKPDGNGTFLYLAGIHSQGTLGAAKYVADNLLSMYRLTKTRRFSTVVSCSYNPQTRGRTQRLQRAAGNILLPPRRELRRDREADVDYGRHALPPLGMTRSRELWLGSARRCVGALGEYPAVVGSWTRPSCS